VDILKGESLFVEEENYYEIEKAISDELNSIKAWMDHLQKQRTSTVEKNMMEIFKEFKKGVDEKIGHEDYDTRYNLGIAYKEMSLVDEAIGEFQIAAKSPSRRLQSCSMVGACFLEKGMPGEAVRWYRRGLETAEAGSEEERGLRYDLADALEKNGDSRGALESLQRVAAGDAGYRDVAQRIGRLSSS